MFKHEYQGGSHFEVFSAQGKDPVAKWKLTGGSGIRKVKILATNSMKYIVHKSWVASSPDLGQGFQK